VFLIHRGFIDDDLLQWITAHELGHYYWGLHVLGAGPDRLDWLNLARGIWVDQLYLSRVNERSLAEQWRWRGQGDPFTDFFTALAGNYDPTLGLTEAEFRALPFDYNSYIRQSKAAVELYLLSLRLGPDRFLDLQREVLHDYAGQPFGPEDFLERLEAREALRFSVEDEGEPCASYRRCEAALLLAETLARLDDTEGAWALLARVRDDATARRLQWRWRQVEGLVGGAH
jgi:hypothetical protein